jgi:hypothetical protein
MQLRRSSRSAPRRRIAVGGRRSVVVGVLALILAVSFGPPALAGQRSHHRRAPRRASEVRRRIHPRVRHKRRHHRAPPHRTTPPPVSGEPPVAAPPPSGSTGTGEAPPQPSPPITEPPPGEVPAVPPEPASPALPGAGIAAGADLQTWPLSNVERELTDFVALHAHWIRHDFAWDAIEPQPGVFTWSGFDRWVASARADAINVIATVTYTPAWANGGSTNHNFEPSSPEKFGEFAGEVAARYGPEGVHTFEIWNEPNIGYWRPVPSPARYAEVLCSAYAHIHAADPHATVLTGGTSPAGDGSMSVSPQTWLTDLYADGARGCFDAVAHHPYVDSSAKPGDLGNAWDLMYDAYPPSNLRAIMTAHGDGGKRIWATEVGCKREALGDAECSSRIAKAFRLWQGFSWAGVLCWFTYWDPNAYGLVTSSWTPRPEWQAYQAAAAAYG